MSIFKKDKNYFVRYRDINGKQRQVKAGKTKAIAQELERKILAERDTQKRFGYKPKKEITFGEWVVEYLERVRPRVSKNTMVNKISCFQNMSKIFGHKYLSEITEEDFYNYIQNVSSGSAKTYQMFLNTLLTEAGECGYNVPELKIKVGKRPPARVRYLTDEEAQRLLSNCHNEELKLLIKMALMTGMRKMEMLNLTWQNIDLQARLIHIEESKNGERRSIPISDSLMRELKAIEEKNSNEKVFKEIKSLYYLFERLLKKSEIENFHFHDLRHTFASWLAIKGVSLYTIKELLGHKSIIMTQRYAHLSPDSRQNAVNMIQL
jgi:integrase